MSDSRYYTPIPLAMRDVIYATAFARAWEVYRDAVRHEEQRDAAGERVGWTSTTLTPREVYDVCDRDARACVAVWEAGQ